MIKRQYFDEPEPENVSEEDAKKVLMDNYDCSWEEILAEMKQGIQFNSTAAYYWWENV